MLLLSEFLEISFQNKSKLLFSIKVKSINSKKSWSLPFSSFKLRLKYSVILGINWLNNFSSSFPYSFIYIYFLFKSKNYD